MDIPIDLGKDVKADLKIVGGKFVLSIEFDGADAVIEVIKSKLPAWIHPALTFLKAEVDQVG